MGKVLITQSILTNIADAIRDKLGITDGIKPVEMAEKIEGMEIGGEDVETKLIDGTITTISLPDSTMVAYDAFNNCTELTAIHFAAVNQATIEALYGYSSKFGAPSKATIYFDL